MEDLSKKPLVDMMIEMTYLEKKIELNILKYNLMVCELYKRFPIIEEQEDYKPKILTKDKIDL